MKKPRIDDFDPKITAKLKSPLDDMPSIQKQPATKVQAITPTMSREPKLDNTTEVTNERSNERTMERRKTRHTFDIFLDQLMSLREIALSRERGFGKRVLLGNLVQEALDLFITGERNKE